MKPQSETKRKLLDTALSLIWEQSYGSVGVDDICRRAGVTKGSFYFAFPSKCDLTVASFEAYWEYKRPLLDAIFSSQVPPLLQVERYLDLIVTDQKEKYRTFGKMCGCPFGSVGCELGTQDEKLRRMAEHMTERQVRYLAGAIRAAQAEGTIIPEDPVTLAQQAYDYISGLLVHARIENDPAVLERLKSGAFRILGVKTEALAPS